MENTFIAKISRNVHKYLFKKFMLQYVLWILDFNEKIALKIFFANYKLILMILMQKLFLYVLKWYFQKKRYLKDFISETKDFHKNIFLREKNVTVSILVFPASGICHF